MAAWSPSPFWRDRPAVVIGGGPSLRGFPFARLGPVCTIGCNRAYELGAKIVDILIFGDMEFWLREHEAIRKTYDGLVVTNAPKIQGQEAEGVLHMRRLPDGLGDKELAWNGNTGASALNLALILGANPVYLLGIDMKAGESQETNWHDGYLAPIPSSVYDRHLGGWDSLRHDLPLKFPGARVVHVTPEGASRLQGFEQIGFDAFWGEIGE